MKGEPGVLDYLNKGLRHELTAINQYWLHYRLLDNWGYRDLAKQWRKEWQKLPSSGGKMVETGRRSLRFRVPAYRSVTPRRAACRPFRP